MKDKEDSALVEGRLATFSSLRADGVGEVFEATREFITDHLKPTLVNVTDPDSGLTVLAIVGNGSARPVSEDFFDGVRNNPRFRRGTAALTSLDSFIAHVNRFGDTGTAVFANDDPASPKLTAVLDYHRGFADEYLPGEIRHGKHRSTFCFPLSEEWKAWVKMNGKVMTMAEASLFFEDRIGDIAIAGDEFPDDVERFVNMNGGVGSIADYATLIELTRGMKVYESANVEEATNLASGEGHIRFTIEHETRGKSGGAITVPKMFFIAVPIFDKGPFYRIGARLRYRKTGEGVKFWYDLYRHDRSFDHAFVEAVTKVDAETPATVFYGAPEA